MICENCAKIKLEALKLEKGTYIIKVGDAEHDPQDEVFHQLMDAFEKLDDKDIKVFFVPYWVVKKVMRNGNKK